MIWPVVARIIPPHHEERCQVSKGKRRGGSFLHPAPGEKFGRLLCQAMHTTKKVGADGFSIRP
jgi:hypothetical protein